MKQLLAHKAASDIGFTTQVERLRTQFKESPQYLSLLEELCQFPLGRFLIENKGIDGYWTDVVVNHPTRGRVKGINSEGEPLTPLEQKSP